MRFLSVLLFPLPLLAADQPQWGQAWGRNMVSGETGLPETFDLSPTAKGLRWSAPLGGESHSTPIVAGGRVYVGTSNTTPRDPRHTGDRGIFLCLDEKTGSLIWQLVCPKLDEDQYFDWPKTGMSSEATVEGERLYLVTNRAEVVCLDVHGLANGNQGIQDEDRRATPMSESVPISLGAKDADVLWAYSLRDEADIWPHDGAHSSILIHGSQLYVNTGNGVDNTHRKIRKPKAPGLVVLDKATGKLLARDEENTAPETFHASWSSPSLTTIAAKEVVTFCGGNGVVYGFQPAGNAAALQRVFQYDPDPSAPRTEVHRYTTNKQEGPSNILGMPVWHEQRLYIAGGGDLFWGKNEAWVQCLEVRPDTKDQCKVTKLWSSALRRHTTCTPCIHDGLVYATDTTGAIHCLDAKDGSVRWVHYGQGDFWASCLVADGKVYAGTRRGQFIVLKAGPEYKVLSETKFPTAISATATAANGSLFISTMDRLYCWE
jgi:outer membrane protein assembly factor BamB